MRKMKALIKHRLGPGLELTEVPIPDIGPREVLIKVEAAGICGSDIPIYEWDDPWVQNTIKPGQIIGHEFCGTVVQCGHEVRTVHEGQYVSAEGHVNCGACSHCRRGESHICPHLKLIGFDLPGGFAEYIVIPESNVIQLCDLSRPIAAILDPFGNAVHATTRVSLANASVLVTGCGPIGLMAISLAKWSGARHIFATDTSPFRRELATRIGASTVLDAADPSISLTIRDFTSEDTGVDVLLEMSGSSGAIVQGFSLLRNGGHAVLMGLPKYPLTFDFSNDLIVKGVTVHGITGRLMFKTWQQAQQILGDGTSLGALDISPIITHCLPLAEFEQGMELMRTGQCGKVVLLIDQS